MLDIPIEHFISAHEQVGRDLANQDWPVVSQAGVVLPDDVDRATRLAIPRLATLSAAVQGVGRVVDEDSTATGLRFAVAGYSSHMAGLAALTRPAND